MIEFIQHINDQKDIISNIKDGDYKDVWSGNVKTESSIRKVDILQSACDALLNQIKLTKGKDYIFLARFDKPFYNHDIINLHFKKILEQNNIKAIKLYNPKIYT